MSYLLKIPAILALLLVMTGCGVHSYTNHTDVSGFPHRYADFDYKYAWKTVVTDQALLIDGVMKNVRYAFIDSVQVKVSVLDKNGNIIATASDFPMPQKTREGDVCIFTLLLRDVKPASGDIFQFQVHYTGNEGDHDGGGVDWYSNFKVDALTGAAILPPGKNPDEW